MKEQAWHVKHLGVVAVADTLCGARGPYSTTHAEVDCPACLVRLDSLLETCPGAVRLRVRGYKNPSTLVNVLFPSNWFCGGENGRLPPHPYDLPTSDEFLARREFLAQARSLKGTPSERRARRLAFFQKYRQRSRTLRGLEETL